MESITEAVLRYQESGSGYSEILNRISLIIYDFPRRNNYMTDEDSAEFYLSFFNRIEGMVNKFSYQGIPFEVLLSKTLHWHSKTYLSDKNNRNKLKALDVREEQIKVSDLLFSCCSEGDNAPLKVEFRNKTSKRRFLFLFLMDSPNINEMQLEYFSELTGYDREWLMYLRDTLNKRLFKRNERLTMLREKRNSTYMKLLYKQEVQREILDSDKKKQLSCQIERLKKSLDNTRYEISRVPIRPTHQEIADLLKVPKGTVDSGLYYFRKKYNVAIKDNSYSLIL